MPSSSRATRSLFSITSRRVEDTEQGRGEEPPGRLCFGVVMWSVSFLVLRSAAVRRSLTLIVRHTNRMRNPRHQPIRAGAVEVPHGCVHCLGMNRFDCRGAVYAPSILERHGYDVAHRKWRTRRLIQPLPALLFGVVLLRFSLILVHDFRASIRGGWTQRSANHNGPTRGQHPNGRRRIGG